MERKKSKIGRGTKMSIAKAALCYYYETMVPDAGDKAFIYSGDLGPIHHIVDIAGAKHCGSGTHHQVLACLNASDYWESPWHKMDGWNGRQANIYRPSYKGQAYYQTHIKHRNL